jgi:hypothetical protein
MGKSERDVEEIIQCNRRLFFFFCVEFYGIQVKSVSRKLNNSSRNGNDISYGQS